MNANEPKDAVAARRIIEDWDMPIQLTASEYAKHLRDNPDCNARGRPSPALAVVSDEMLAQMAAHVAS